MEGALVPATPFPLTQCCCKPPISSSSFCKLSGLQNSVCLSFPACVDHREARRPVSNVSNRRSFGLVVKASDAQVLKTQNEVLQQEAQSENKGADSTIEQSNELPSAVTAETTQKDGEKTGKVWLLRSATEGGKGQEIAPGDGILVGANPKSDGSSIPFVVDFPMVSSTHARVFGRERQTYKTTLVDYFVMDLGSTNGTYLNRSRLRPQTEVKLSSGDMLKFGDEKAVFVVETES
ncbi:hypothetical protein L7F22_063194 [Adiantum nelumboides]|nr:hypothetical protein [Adiantum nelumboides]